jgi:hypothetical protein
VAYGPSTMNIKFSWWSHFNAAQCTSPFIVPRVCMLLCVVYNIYVATVQIWVSIKRVMLYFVALFAVYI